MSEQPEAKGAVGAVNGLAVAEGGGMVLLVEATAVPGEGRLTITGGCGDEFAKSARIAVQCVIEMFKETK